MSFLIGVFAHFACLIFGFQSAGLFKLVSLSVVAGFFSSLTLLFTADMATLLVYKIGLDPDNVMGPYVTTIGDAVSILYLFIVAKMVLMG